MHTQQSEYLCGICACVEKLEATTFRGSFGLKSVNLPQADGCKQGNNQRFLVPMRNLRPLNPKGCCALECACYMIGSYRHLGDSFSSANFQSADEKGSRGCRSEAPSSSCRRVCRTVRLCRAVSCHYFLTFPGDWFKISLKSGMIVERSPN